MSKGVNNVIEEMFPGVRLRKRVAAEEIASSGSGEDSPSSPEPAKEPPKAEQPQQEPKKRRRRTMQAATKAEGLLDANMYSISLVGGIVMPGYQLKPGEKLVIAKLTPLVIEK